MLSAITAYLYALAHGCPIALSHCLAMGVRRSRALTIARHYVRARKAALNLSIEELEAHALAQGRPGQLVDAMIEADRLGLELPVGIAAAQDLVGLDIVQEVRDAAAARKRGDTEHRLLLAIQFMPPSIDEDDPAR